MNLSTSIKRNPVVSFIKRQPLLAFLVIAIAPIWITIPLAVGNPTLQVIMTLISTPAPKANPDYGHCGIVSFAGAFTR